jgi:hypothetical protein
MVPIIAMGIGVLELVAIPAILLLIGVSLFVAIRNGQRRREWEHAERMTALQMGLPVPPRDAPWAKAAVSIAVGLGVPLVAFGFTYLAFTDKPAAAPQIWIAPGVVGGLSVIGASILAGSLFQGGSRSAPMAAADRRHGPGMKPTHDPDALDVVGSRG